jgi:hypothetical protein
MPTPRITQTSITSSSRGEILKEASEIDAAEDELYGDARGDELPEHRQTSEGRRGALAEAKRKARARARQERECTEQGGRRGRGSQGEELDGKVIVPPIQGHEGWLREARRQLDDTVGSGRRLMPTVWLVGPETAV